MSWVGEAIDARPAMGLQAEGLGKRYGRVWILRKVSFELVPGGRLVVRGGNGSGKSSLLRLICGLDRASEGLVSGYFEGGTVPGLEALKAELLPDHTAYSAPDQHLIVDLTAREQLAFHARFRGFKPGLTPETVLEAAQLSGHGDKMVGNLSSGMRQRLELAIAMGTQAKLLVLDEPVSHLDRAGVAWYGDLQNRWCAGQTIITGSNYHGDEYPEGAEFLDLTA